MWIQDRAFFGAMLEAIYAVYEACSIRQSFDPFTFLAWFFVLTALSFVHTALRSRRAVAPVGLGVLMWGGFAGMLIALVNIGCVMFVTRLSSLIEAVAPIVEG